MIKATRGDTIALQFQRKDLDGEPITTTPTAIYFTVKESFDVPFMVIQKTLADMEMDADGFWHFTIAPAETEVLPYGEYVYDVEVTDEGAVITIAKGAFVLEGEATWQVNK